MRFFDAVEYQGFWGSFWDLVWWFLWAFVFFAYLMALFSIIGDLFRDHKLSGWWKAVWIFFLIFFPIITALIYLVARGGGMAERSAQAAQSYREQQDAYIKTVAGSGSSPSEEIAKAKRLLDDGTITPSEYEALKSKALAGG
ncbi:SHOCT domain-containing protein [Microbacterium sp. zg-YB36]|uniref:SHOCT domain-containing protein n=1 Tax=Microbacterium sp. zg-YB36 TaxID=2969407 RepID=UPI00214C14A8|nr:SHOCT domain-containing protein [Microbacterium sp. zg-YB36]MDL5350620.1 SHOCT domain-containing protein [Microbacterium sp. zg-YB36]